MGAAGGVQNQQISQSQLPNVGVGLTASGSVSVSVSVGLGGGAAFPYNSTGVGNAQVNAGTGGFVPIAPGAWGSVTSIGGSGSGSASVSGATNSINGNVPQNGLIMPQPTIITNYILYAGA